MRLARIVGALVALILTVATLGQALVSPAEANGKPHHQLSVKGGEVGNTNHFFIKGKVATYPKKKITVLRNVNGGPYKPWKKIKTKASGKFRTPITEAGRAKTCFKVQVPGTAAYKKTTSPIIGCITTS